MLASPDPANPLADIPDELKYMINLNSGVKIAIYIKQDLPEGCNWNVDAAMCGNYAKGSLGMNELVIPGRKCEGINIFSCGIDCPFDTGVTDANLIDRIEAKLDNNPYIYTAAAAAAAAALYKFFQKIIRFIFKL